MFKKRGTLISLEGTEGSGKSTLIEQISNLLNQMDYPTLCTREPGGCPVAEKIRSVLLEMPMDPWTELLLYEAARAEHLAKIIQPALSEGKIVLCDRFTDSTLAYQAYARGLPWKKVKTLNFLATRGIEPDLTLFLDIDPEKGLSRARDTNRFEAEGIAFHKKVREGFLKARRENPKRWLTFQTADHSPQELAQQAIEGLKKKLKNQLREIKRDSF